MGGDCLNVGCVPSKGLLRAAGALYHGRQASRLGVNGAEDLTIDFGRAMGRMQAVRAWISRHDSAPRFRDELGVDVFLGEGRFVGLDRLEVGGRTLSFRRAAICTGARAAVPLILGLAEAGFLTNETVFSLAALPPRLAVIGAGPLGCELAQAFARMGSQVHLLQRSDRILPREDPVVSGLLQERFGREGIKISLAARITRVERRGRQKVLFFEQQGKTAEVAVEEVLVGVGRAPNVERLGLEAAGVEYDSGGVKVSDRLQTANPRIFAAGDICSPYKFTHLADAQARLLIVNALFHGRRNGSNPVVPWCTYTDPEVARVGLGEAEAREQGVEVDTLTVPLAEVDRARIDGETEGFARVHLKKGSDRILGATVVAPHAGEMISELTLAMTAGLGLKAVAATIHPYPTQAEVIRKLGDAYNRTRLTPRIRKALGFWCRWQRWR